MFLSRQTDVCDWTHRLLFYWILLKIEIGKHQVIAWRSVLPNMKYLPKSQKVFWREADPRLAAGNFFIHDSWNCTTAANWILDKSDGNFFIFKNHWCNIGLIFISQKFTNLWRKTTYFYNLEEIEEKHQFKFAKIMSNRALIAANIIDICWNLLPLENKNKFLLSVIRLQYWQKRPRFTNGNNGNMPRRKPRPITG